MKLRTLPLLLAISIPIGLSACNIGSTTPTGHEVDPTPPPVKKSTVLIVAGSDKNGFGGISSFDTKTESFVEIADRLGTCPLTSLTKTDDGVIYAGGCDDSGVGAVYSSQDSSSWGVVESQLGNGAITSLASKLDTVYAGGNYSGGEIGYGQIFTFENGIQVTGNLFESQIGYGTISSMAISESGTLYIGNLDNDNHGYAFGLISSVSINSAVTVDFGIGYSNCPINALALDKSGNLYAAGNGLALTGSTFAAVAGNGIVVGASISIDTTVVAQKYSCNVGDGSSSTITVTHNLNTFDVLTQIRIASSNQLAMCDIQNATLNTVVLGFGAYVPPLNSLRVSIVG